MLSKIRYRLAALNLVVLSLVLAVTVASAIVGEIRSVDFAIEHELRDGAQKASAVLLREHHHERPSNDADHDDDDDDGESEEQDQPSKIGSNERNEQSDLGADAPGLIFFWVNTGSTVVRSDRRSTLRDLPDKGALQAALDGRESDVETLAAGEPVRILTVPVAHDGHVIGAVQVVKVLRESRAGVSRTIVTFVITGVLGLVLSAVGSWFLAGRAMRPIGEALEKQRRFIADASHELRTPVAVLRARAELVEREAGEAPTQVQSELVRLRRDAEELTTLLTDLLDLARLDAGQESVHTEAIALGDAAGEMVEELLPLAEVHKVVLHARPSSVFAQAHLGRTRQVLRALIDNAVKHTPPGGKVTVSVETQGEKAVLSVADDGEGIAPEHLPHVFDRFFRARIAANDGVHIGARGSGLGLSIAEQLVKSMNGEIRVESALQKGTTVTVLLPRARPA